MCASFHICERNLPWTVFSDENPAVSGPAQVKLLLKGQRSFFTSAPRISARRLGIVQSSRVTSDPDTDPSVREELTRDAMSASRTSPWPGSPGPSRHWCVLISGAKQLLASEASRELWSQERQHPRCCQEAGGGLRVKASSGTDALWSACVARAAAGLQACRRQAGRWRLWSQGPLLPLPHPGAQWTHSLTRQRLAKGPPVRVPGTAQSGKTEVGKQCLTSQSVPDVGLRSRMWESAGKTAQGLGLPW